jgi:hypothetical protein
MLPPAAGSDMGNGFSMLEKRTKGVLTASISGYQILDHDFFNGNKLSSSLE